MTSKMLRGIVLILFVFSLTACGSEPGQLEIRANGEDFVRQGFVSKDGWSISFEHLFVTVRNVNAYQTDPPYDAATGEDPEGISVSIPDTVTVDLAAGDESADPILVQSVEAEAGQYNAIGWEMEVGDSGYSIQLIGVAEKEDELVNFDIKIDSGYRYVCGEYVGDERKGFVDPGNSDDIEMTFHVDHIFGDASLGENEPLNADALGFGPLAELAVDDELDITLAELEIELNPEDARLLAEALASLGHVGEGHCFESAYGFTAKDE